jgi:hypothetical protein
MNEEWIRDRNRKDEMGIRGRIQVLLTDLRQPTSARCRYSTHPATLSAKAISTIQPQPLFSRLGHPTFSLRPYLHPVFALHERIPRSMCVEGRARAHACPNTSRMQIQKHISQYQRGDPPKRSLLCVHERERRDGVPVPAHDALDWRAPWRDESAWGVLVRGKYSPKLKGANLAT